MVNTWRPFWRMFYHPVRGASEVRERAPLAQATLLAVIAQVVYLLLTQWSFFAAGPSLLRAPYILFSAILQAGGSLIFLALIFVPLTILIANLLERRGSFGLVLQQEYAALASVLFYAWAAASIAALPVALVAKLSGFQTTIVALSVQQVAAMVPPEAITNDITQRLTGDFYLLLRMPFFCLWALVGVREVFRFSWVRALATVALGVLLMVFVGYNFSRLFGSLFASPLLLIMLFFLLRGYFGEVVRTQRARADFKRNLESATLNPADASAHYNLGLIYLQRNDLAAARASFTRAVTIDPEEVDAHYQLGRIARAEHRYVEAIAHYEQVVTRDQTHSQHEIWREIGATYIAAGQYNDAADALERFLAHRPSDPEALYLNGRAFAGLGRRGEAADAMRACIEAVRTAPAYKYRTEKRWLTEAQQFLRSHI